MATFPLGLPSSCGVQNFLVVFKTRLVWSGGTASGTAPLVGLIQAPHDKVGMEESNDVAVSGSDIADDAGGSKGVATGRTGSVGE